MTSNPYVGQHDEIVRCEAVAPMKYFLRRGGSRHWILDGAWLGQNTKFGVDVRDVTLDEFKTFKPGRPVARAWDNAERFTVPQDSSLVLRGLACSFAEGVGMEIGAGANPLPIPLNCTVTYGDRFDHQQLTDMSYSNPNDLVMPTVNADFDDLSNIPLNSLDFIASCHVIEHTRNPIRALVDSSRRLRRGGKIILIVPDMCRTFDRDRQLTPLVHFVTDYLMPSHDRDRQHFQEFYQKVEQQPADTYDSVWRQRWEENFPIHYHTWTYESFGEMLSWIQAELNSFRVIWSNPTLSAQAENEFYYVLETI